MRVFKTAVLTAALSVALLAGSASAMPVGGLGAAANELAGNTQQVVWVCGWRRCWWRPVYVYPAPYYYYAAPWPYYRPYWGWRRWWW